MSNKSVLKKSVFGGFKKEDVINYIEQLQQENVNLKRELGECSSYKRDFLMMKNSAEKAESELNSQREENVSLKTKNSELIEINASLNLRVEEMKVCLDNCERKLRECEERAKKLEYDLAESEKNYSKIREAEAVISQAESTALSIRKEAKNSIETAKGDVVAASDRIKTACVNFDSAAASLKASTENLLNALSQVSEKLETAEVKDA